MKGILRSKLVLTLAAFLMIAAAIAIPLASSVTRSHAASNFQLTGRLWAYDAAGSNAPMRVWDLATENLTTTFVPRDGNGRGVAFDPTDGNIWNTTLHSVDFSGDGLIHKNPPLGGPDITTIPDPGGVNGPGIGALDYDPEENVLWAAAYQPVNGQSLFYKLNPSNGNILKTCSLPFQGGGVGNDTLAIARPADLGGAKVFLTDAGELLSTLSAVDVNSCTVLKTYTLPVEVSGIDVDATTGDLVATDTSTFYNLGPAPYNTSIATFPTQGAVEDISLTTSPNILWGVDSSEAITTNFYNRIVTAFGVPDFFGRYIGDSLTSFPLHPQPNHPCDPKGSNQYAYQISPKEVTTAQSLKPALAILPIYFAFPQSYVQTFTCGQNYAKAAIEFAQRAPGFAIKQGTAIFVDIECCTGINPDAAFIQGWYDTFNTTFAYTSPYDSKSYTYQAGYYKAGYYANTGPSTNFNAPFCAAVNLEPAIGTNSFIWTDNITHYITDNPPAYAKAVKPPYTPTPVSCTNQQIPIPAAWQYGQSNGYKVNVDADEALASLPLWHP